MPHPTMAPNGRVFPCAPMALALAVLSGAATPALAQAPPAAEQIAAALHAAPEERRAEATVLGWESGALVTLRQGANDLVCLADDPVQEGFSAACYHVSLEPFMARGRELAAQGITGADRQRARWAEAEAGTLSMPTEPATLYVLSGKAYDAAADSVVDGSLRWVIYVPGATPASTGLPVTPGAGPWLMFPGTPGAHIMISPTRPAPPALPRR